MTGRPFVSVSDALKEKRERAAANPTIRTRTCVRMFVDDGKWLWSGGLDTRYLQLLTTDPDLRPELRSFVDEHSYGVEMVDQHGTRLTYAGTLR